MSTEHASDLAERDLTHAIIGAFYYVYNRLGYGFLESVYSAALARVLTSRGHAVETQVRVPVWFEGEIIAQHRLDFVVDDRVVLEIKATETLPASAPRQLANYLAATHYQVGLLLHFSPRGAEVQRRVNVNHRYQSPDRGDPGITASRSRPDRLV